MPQQSVTNCADDQFGFSRINVKDRMAIGATKTAKVESSFMPPYWNRKSFEFWSNKHSCGKGRVNVFEMTH